MAKRKRSRTKPSGPFVNAAVFCENPLEDKSGMVSIIRMFDRTEGELPPEFQVGDSAAINIWFFVAVKSGDAKGGYHLELFFVAPDGERKKVTETSLDLKGAEQGGNLRANLTLAIQSEGLYWMDVVIDGKTITRSPLRVVLRRPAETQSAKPGSPRKGP